MFGLAKRVILISTIVLGAVIAVSGSVAHASCPEVGFAVVERHATPETRPVRVGGNRTIFVRRVPITKTSDIAEIRLVADDDDDASLLIKFTPAADQRLHDATTNHSGMRVAFLFGDEVLVDTV